MKLGLEQPLPGLLQRRNGLFDQGNAQIRLAEARASGGEMAQMRRWAECQDDRAAKTTPYKIAA